MPLQILDFGVNHLPLSGPFRLKFAIAGHGHGTVELAFLGAPELDDEPLTSFSQFLPQQSAKFTTRKMAAKRKLKDAGSHTFAYFVIFVGLGDLRIRS